MEDKDGIEPVPALARLAAGRQPDSWPLERGRLVHRLLELLPDLPAVSRMAAAERFLDQALKPVFAPFKDTLLKKLEQVLDEPEFQPVFSENGRAEVTLTGTIRSANGTDVEVSGQIDRLIVDGNEVVIVDYKTNTKPPETLDQVPLEYRAQLSVYKELLRQIYPAKTVRCHLLWTTGPSLMEIPGDLLDETFAGLAPEVRPA